MKKLLILLLLVVIQFAGQAQNLSPAEEQLKKALDDFMAQVSSGKADEGFATLLRTYWREKATAPQATDTMQRQYRDVIGRAENSLGAPVSGGYEYVGVKRLGSSVLKLVYLQKNEYYFLPWAFSFYKPRNEWRLSFVSFPDVGSEDLRDFITLDLANPKGQPLPARRSAENP